MKKVFGYGSIAILLVSSSTFAYYATTYHKQPIKKALVSDNKPVPWNYTPVDTPNNDQLEDGYYNSHPVSATTTPAQTNTSAPTIVRQAPSSCLTTVPSYSPYWTGPTYVTTSCN